MVRENTPRLSAEEERRELEAVTAALAHFSRLLRLITYIGEKYFSGETDQLSEYSIATEVFGRSRSTFNPGEDAIVRVEAHRLRKRLKEYYEKEGKDHPVHLSIPPGSYVPVFTRTSAVLIRLESEETAPARSASGWWYYVGAAVIVLAVLGSYLAFRSPHANNQQTPVNAAPSSAPAVLPVNGVVSDEAPVRIIAGYNGKPQIDSAGAVWQPDHFFYSGGTWNRPEGFIARTSDPMLFAHWRNGDFSYDIPLRPGVYEVHLFFVTPEAASNGASTFGVFLNDQEVLTGFDINSDALGSNIADERVFRDVRPGSNGKLHIGFQSERASPTVSAIEILPGTPHKQLPIRIVMQPTSLTDHNGQFWHADNYYMDGYISTKRSQVSGTSDPDLFAAERYGHFTYAIPVDTRGRFTLILHFAELYFGPGASGTGGLGSRVFRVQCNGDTLLDNFDIFKEAGSLHALTKTFSHLKPTAQGKLNLTFEPIVNNATVSGIEVIEESE
jgi:hypothetical protein